MRELIESGVKDSNLLTAMLFHDCGKPFCKQFKNNKGEDTEIAHYYGHENYGAYIFISKLTFLDEDTNNLLEVANYIQWHMRLFELEHASQKTKDKFVNMVGLNTFVNLQIMNLADISAK